MEHMNGWTKGSERFETMGIRARITKAKAPILHTEKQFGMSRNTVRKLI